MKAAFIFLLVSSLGVSNSLTFGQTEKQTPGGPAAREPYVAPARVVDLNVLVLDREKHPVTGLDAASFQVTEDGAPRTIQSVAAAGGPISLCLVVDDSGSTKAMRQPIGNAVTELVKGLPAGSEVMVVHFADRAYLDVPFTPAASVDWGKVQLKESRGGTALYDALVAAGEFVSTRAHEQRRALVILSDGLDNASSLKLEEAVRRLAVPGAPMIYALRFSDGDESRAESDHAEGALGKLTKADGGLTLTARSAAEMEKMAEQILGMIDSQVVVSFASPDSVNPGQLHRLEVRKIEGEKGEELHAMPGFYVRGPAAWRGAN